MTTEGNKVCKAELTSSDSEDEKQGELQER